MALVHEVPPAAAGAADAEREEAEGEEGSSDEEAGGRRPLPHASRAEASANVEPDPQHGAAAQRGAAGDSWQDSEQLRAAMEQGSLEALLALGVPRLDAGAPAGGTPGAGFAACVASCAPVQPARRAPVACRMHAHAFNLPCLCGRVTPHAEMLLRVRPERYAAYRQVGPQV